MRSFDIILEALPSSCGPPDCVLYLAGTDPYLFSPSIIEKLKPFYTDCHILFVSSLEGLTDVCLYVFGRSPTHKTANLTDVNRKI